MADTTYSLAKAADPVYTPHPYALIFPPMGAEAFAALLADIKANGLREPITVNAREQILDGVNRNRACLEAGVEPRFELKDIPDNEVLSFVLSRNLHRRHLTTSQRAAAAASLVNLSQDGPANLRVTQAAGAKLFNVSERNVHEALGVLKQSPELHEAAAAGQVSTHLCAQIAALPEAETAEALKNLKQGDVKGARALVVTARSKVPKEPKGADKKAARSIVQDAAPLEVKVPPVAKKARTPSSASSSPKSSRRSASADFECNGFYSAITAELDELPDLLTAHPLTSRQAQHLIAELRRAIERIENAIKE